MKFRDLFVAIAAFSMCPTVAAAQFPVFRSAAGVRAGYGSVGGDQFSSATDGVVFGAFVRLPIGPRFGVELGASGQSYREYFLCPGFGPCLSPDEPIVTGIHVAPVMRATVPGTPLVLYGGPLVGAAFAHFQDGDTGLETGLIIGGAGPVYRDLAVDVSVVRSMIHVGTELPRSGFGQRLSFQIGLTYALREGPVLTSR